MSAGGFSLPLKGVVAAGKAIEAEETDERLEMRDLFGSDDLFVVKVRGQSMIDGQIADGDYVVIRKKETCENGEKVVAMVDKAYTLKKYYRKKDQIRLEPMNIISPARRALNCWICRANSSARSRFSRRMTRPPRLRSPS